MPEKIPKKRDFFKISQYLSQSLVALKDRRIFINIDIMQKFARVDQMTNLPLSQS